MHEEKFFLVIGLFPQEALRSRLKTTGVKCIQKLLKSTPKNWESIIDLMESPNLIGVVAKFERLAYALMHEDEYSVVAPRFLAALGKVSHIVFVHEDILSGSVTDYLDKGVVHDLLNDQGLYVGTQLPQATTDFVNKSLSEHEINVSTYKTNAELSVLADAFAGDHESNLLFRIYIPRGRIFSTEMGRILSLFHDWLNNIKKENIRQDGYTTKNGQVFEFFSERKMSPDDIQIEMKEFKKFLDICDDPIEAESLLRGLGISSHNASGIVTRYSKEVRRIQVDMRQEREDRIMRVRHRLESELIDSLPLGIGMNTVSSTIDALIPSYPEEFPVLHPTVEQKYNRDGKIYINQQIIDRVYGEVHQNISGDQSMGIEAQALLSIIRDHGGSETMELNSSVHEVADREARTADRLSAKQRLKSFLIRSRDNIESAAYGIAQSYVENQIGL